MPNTNDSGLRRLVSGARLACALCATAILIEALSSGAAVAAGTGRAGDSSLGADEAGELRALIEEQRKRIEAQQKALERQRRRLEAQRERIEALEYDTSGLKNLTRGLIEARSAMGAVPIGVPLYGEGSEGYRFAPPGAARIRPAVVRYGPEVAQAGEGGQAPNGATPAPGAEPPEVALLAERGGVLTPEGGLVIEPSIEFAKSTSNRLNFRGISIVEGFLVGIIEATDSDRDTVTGALTARYGITDRLEVEAKVPYVVRNDRVTSTVTGTPGDFTLTDNFDGHGLGDVEGAAHYQVNMGAGGWPFFVANLRYKSNTGTGPFDVGRDPDGVPTELATGSGAHGVEPSVTVIYPSDPAVLFANVGYLVNFEHDVDKTIGGSRIGTVDPGDSLGISFGVGVALNEDLSLSFGYQHDFVGETTTEIDGVEVDSETLSVGSLLFGTSYRLSNRVGLNLSTQVGATADAPDVQLMLRMPISFQLY